MIALPSDGRGSMQPGAMVTVLYFAAIRELAGVGEETFDAGAPLGTIRELREHLERLHPAMAGRLGRVRFSRNQQFAPDDTVICDGDEIGLIPPVAGG